MTARCRAILDGTRRLREDRIRSGRRTSRLVERASVKACGRCGRPVKFHSRFCALCGSKKAQKRIAAYFKRTGLLPIEEARRIFAELKAARA